MDGWLHGPNGLCGPDCIRGLLAHKAGRAPYASEELLTDEISVEEQAAIDQLPACFGGIIDGTQHVH